MSPIRLLVSDVDGTLVRSDKSLSPATLDAARSLREHDVQLAVVSSRATIGLDVLIEPLALDTPRAGFNGGVILAPDGRVLEEHVIPEASCREAVRRLEAAGLDVWLFADGRWLLKNEAVVFIEHERRSLNAGYEVTHDFTPWLGRTHKLMGSSGDFDLVARLETELAASLGPAVAVHRSQLFHIDITAAQANKGSAALSIARLLGVDRSELACIGDMGNDIPMLQAAALPIAMGNAPEAVRTHAQAVVAAADDDGWAEAVRTLILPRAARR